jgi:hypothetical protein
MTGGRKEGRKDMGRKDMHFRRKKGHALQGTGAMRQSRTADPIRATP